MDFFLILQKGGLVGEEAKFSAFAWDFKRHILHFKKIGFFYKMLELQILTMFIFVWKKNQIQGMGKY